MLCCNTDALTNTFAGVVALELTVGRLVAVLSGRQVRYQCPPSAKTPSPSGHMGVSLFFRVQIFLNIFTIYTIYNTFYYILLHSMQCYSISCILVFSYIVPSSNLYSVLDIFAKHLHIFVTILCQFPPPIPHQATPVKTLWSNQAGQGVKICAPNSWEVSLGGVLGVKALPKNSWSTTFQPHVNSRHILSWSGTEGLGRGGLVSRHEFSWVTETTRP